MCSRGRTLLTTAVIFAALALAALPARADPTKEQCIEANASAQDLRRDGKLTTARERLQSCAQPACPALVRDDCSRRLDELDKIQPSIVFEVRDAAGKDITAVQTSMDDRRIAETLSGVALLVDPGQHTFTFEVAGQPPVVRSIVLHEGEKNRIEPVVIATAGASASPRSAPPAGEGGSRTAPLRLAGWVVGGVGAAGLAIGAVFGGLAISDKSGAHCNSDNLCEPGPLGDARTAARVADVSLIAGGALLAGGAALVLFGAPHHERAARLLLTPSLGAGRGGVSLDGTW